MGKKKGKKTASTKQAAPAPAKAEPVEANVAGKTASMADGTCAAADCGLAATLRCPECVKLCNDEGSLYCSKQCFTNDWKRHKKLHKVVTHCNPIRCAKQHF